MSDWQANESTLGAEAGLDVSPVLLPLLTLF